jgi:hypothetical protein
MAANKKEPDWVAIEGEYRAGVHSLRAIAEKHGITEGAIRKRAKAKGWLRDPGATKRAIVNAHFASTAKAGTQESTQSGTHAGTQSVLATIEDAAQQDILDMERALRINRHCLLNLEVAAEKSQDPKEIKIIVEATGAAVASIRKIRGLDAPNSADVKDIDAAIEAELANMERGRQAGAPADAQSA